jgi:hypothetical protein
MGIEDLVIVREGEPLIDRHEVVQMRRPVAPVAKEEEGWRNGHVLQLGAITPLLVPTEDAVLEALPGNGRRPGKAGGGDGEMVVAEHLHPIARGDASQQTGAEVAQEGVTPCHFPTSFYA